MIDVAVEIFKDIMEWVPLTIAIYILFDLIGSLLFGNK